MMSKGKRKQRRRKNQTNALSSKEDGSQHNGEVGAKINKDTPSKESVVKDTSGSNELYKAEEVSITRNETDSVRSESTDNSTEGALKAVNDELQEKVYAKQNIIDTLKNEKMSAASKNDEKLKDEKEKYEKLSKAMDSLRCENTQLKEEMETLKGNREIGTDTDGKIKELEKQLQEKCQEHDKVQENYHSLLNRLSSMKSVFTKMKASESELEKLKGQLEKAEESNGSLKEQNSNLASDIRQLHSDMNKLNLDYEKLSRAKTGLEKTAEIRNNEYSLEVKRLKTGNKKLAADLQEVKSEIEEYIIMIDEEKASKQSLQHEIDEINQKCDNVLKEKEKISEKSKHLSMENSKLTQEIESLKTKYSTDIKELRIQLAAKNQELLSQQGTLNELNKLRDSYHESQHHNAALQEEMKSKQKIIGKLRRETIALNEHLTKAMKLIKQESSQETVDRELVSNLFISFLQIPRGDSKKYEVLQLISNYLNWSDDMRRHAGLLSSNSKVNSNSVVSTPADKLNPSRSFVSMWTEFLEKESTPRQ